MRARTTTRLIALLLAFCLAADPALAQLRTATQQAVASRVATQNSRLRDIPELCTLSSELFVESALAAMTVSGIRQALDRHLFSRRWWKVLATRRRAPVPPSADVLVVATPADQVRQILDRFRVPETPHPPANRTRFALPGRDGVPVNLIEIIERTLSTLQASDLVAYAIHEPQMQTALHHYGFGPGKTIIEIGGSSDYMRGSDGLPLWPAVYHMGSGRIELDVYAYYPDSTASFGDDWSSLLNEFESNRLATLIQEHFDQAGVHVHVDFAWLPMSALLRSPGTHNANTVRIHPYDPEGCYFGAPEVLESVRRAARERPGPYQQWILRKYLGRYYDHDSAAYFYERARQHVNSDYPRKAAKRLLQLADMRGDWEERKRLSRLIVDVTEGRLTKDALLAELPGALDRARPLYAEADIDRLVADYRKDSTSAPAVAPSPAITLSRKDREALRDLHERSRQLRGELEGWSHIDRTSGRMTDALHVPANHELARLVVELATDMTLGDLAPSWMAEGESKNIILMASAALSGVNQLVGTAEEALQGLVFGLTAYKQLLDIWKVSVHDVSLRIGEAWSLTWSELAAALEQHHGQTPTVGFSPLSGESYLQCLQRYVEDLIAESEKFTQTELFQSLAATLPAAAAPVWAVSAYSCATTFGDGFRGSSLAIHTHPEEAPPSTSDVAHWFGMPQDGFRGVLVPTAQGLQLLLFDIHLHDTALQEKLTEIAKTFGSVFVECLMRIGFNTGASMRDAIAQITFDWREQIKRYALVTANGQLPVIAVGGTVSSDDLKLYHPADLQRLAKAA